MRTFSTLDPHRISRTNIAAVITNSEMRILYCQRSASKKFLPHVWHLPGGKIEEGETWEEALRRELAEELMVEVLKTRILPFTHLYSQAEDLHQTLFAQVMVEGSIQLNSENAAYEFLSIDQLPQYLDPSVLELNREVCRESLLVPLVSF